MILGLKTNKEIKNIMTPPLENEIAYAIILVTTMHLT